MENAFSLKNSFPRLHCFNYQHICHIKYKSPYPLLCQWYTHSDNPFKSHLIASLYSCARISVKYGSGASSHRGTKLNLRRTHTSTMPTTCITIGHNIKRVTYSICSSTSCTNNYVLLSCILGYRLGKISSLTSIIVTSL